MRRKIVFCGLNVTGLAILYLLVQPESFWRFMGVVTTSAFLIAINALGFTNLILTPIAKASEGLCKPTTQHDASSKRLAAL